jgi:hypothetical protein
VQKSVAWLNFVKLSTPHRWVAAPFGRETGAKFRYHHRPKLAVLRPKSCGTTEVTQLPPNCTAAAPMPQARATTGAGTESPLKGIA